MKEFNKISFKTVKTKQTEERFEKERTLKNVNELYEKYCNAYKSDNDTGDELNEAKKKKFDHNQFKLVDKTDKELKIDKETKKFIEQVKEKEKGVDKKRFSEYFNYQPNALVSKLLFQNMQDLKKGLDGIKQQNIKFDINERNSTINNNENDRLNMILSLNDMITNFLNINIG